VEGLSGPPGLALAVNAGSTSLKAAAFAPGAEDPVWFVDVDADGIGPDRRRGFEQVLRSFDRLADVHVAGHRVVHGGAAFDRPVIIDAAVESAITSLEDLAPLHNQAALDGLAAARAVLDAAVVHVAVFDTAFHRTMPAAAATYGGPHEWLDAGLRRYGFHGISHEHAAHATAAILGRPVTECRIVTCHLGGGCSLAAVDGGRSVDTTMGFTPLDGLVMATRSGSVDPGLLLHLLRTGTPVEELDDLLTQRSGLLGLSGVSDDLRDVLAARDAGDERAALAIDVFVHRVAAGVGAMIAALGRVDALAFTGGIGEHSHEVRARVVGRFAFLGAAVDPGRNAAGPLDADVSAPGATVSTVIVQAREELAIARAASALAA